MIKKLKKLKEKYGAAQVCVWMGVRDTRTLNTWLSKEVVPFHMQDKVKEVTRERS